MRASELIKYYSQQGFRDFMISFSKGREVVPRFGNYFGERPQTFKFDGELIDVIRRGVTSFHCSEECWSNPLSLSPDMSRKDLDSIRSGWDLIFDVDTKVFEYAKICTKLIVDALDFHEVRPVSVKFSGSTGFHVGVRFTQPTRMKGKLVKDLYPEAPRIIGLYVQEMIKDYLKDMIVEKGKELGEEFEPDFDPLKVVNIDPVAISSRHLIRAPYSLNEKRWLVSVPVDPSRILEFEREEARPDVVKFDRGFLDAEVDSTELFVQAFDWYEREESKKVVERKRNIEIPKNAVSVDKFPPCVQRILAGLPDGRKRGLFVLTHFYHKTGYSWDVIEERLREWNDKNNPPLRGNLIRAQVDWARKQGGLMPNNCSNPNYRDMGVCHPDGLCPKIKNPVTYALHKQRMASPKTRKKSVKEPGELSVKAKGIIKVLESVINIGPVTAKELYAIGIRSVSQLKDADPEVLYNKLKAKSGGKLDKCVLYQLRGAKLGKPWAECKDKA